METSLAQYSGLGTFANSKGGSSSQSLQVGDTMALKDISNEIRNHHKKIGSVYNAIKDSVLGEAAFQEKLQLFGNAAGFNASQLDSVRNKLRSLSTEIMQSKESLLSGMNILIKDGFKPDIALAAVESIGRAAIATGTKVESVSKMSSALMGTMHVPVNDLERAFDSLSASAQGGGVQIKDLADQFPDLARAAARSGLTGANGVASLGSSLQFALRNAASPDAAVGNLTHFLDQVGSQDSIKNFQKFGIDIKAALADGIDKGENPIDVVLREIAAASGQDLNTVMAEAFDANGKIVPGAINNIRSRFKLNELFSDQQSQDFLIPMLADHKGFQQEKDKSLSANGIVNNNVQGISQSFNGSIGKLGYAWENFKGSIGHDALPLLTTATGFLTGMLIQFSELAETFPNVTLGIIGAVGAILALREAVLLGRYAIAFFRKGLGTILRETIGLGTGSSKTNRSLGCCCCCDTDGERGRGPEKRRTGSRPNGKRGSSRTKSRRGSGKSASRGSSSKSSLLPESTSQNWYHGLGGLFSKKNRSAIGRAWRSSQKSSGGLGFMSDITSTAADALNPAMPFQDMIGGVSQVIQDIGSNPLKKLIPKKGFGGKALKLVSKGLGGVGSLLNVYSTVNDLMDPTLSTQDKAGSVGNMAGGMAGALAGAAVGSVVPVIGTVIGGAVGGLIGAYGGEGIGRWLASPSDEAKGGEQCLAPPSACMASPSMAMPAYASCAPAAIGPTTINVYGSPGMDIQELASQVFRLIEDRRRGALYD